MILACVGEELTEAEGQFTSPGYPEDYPLNQMCTWHIKVKNGSRVELQLQIIDIYDTDAIMVGNSMSSIIFVFINTLLIHLSCTLELV